MTLKYNDIKDPEDYENCLQCLKWLGFNEDQIAAWKAGGELTVLPDTKIVCLCGSTRFVDTFNEWRKKLTLQGEIVLGIELVVPQTHQQDPQHSDYATKLMLDELHKRKIDLADYIYVLNVGGYIGESTRSEIDYAIKIGKPVNYLEK